MSLTDYDATLDEPDDPRRCEIHGCYGHCVECLNDKLDRRDQERKEREP